MANKIDEIITVDNEKDLKSAIKNKYGKIYIEGILAERISEKVESANAKSTLGTVGVIGGFALGTIFAPLASIGAVAILVGGAAGLTAGDLKKYNACKEENGKIYLLRK